MLCWGQKGGWLKAWVVCWGHTRLVGRAGIRKLPLVLLLGVLSLSCRILSGKLSCSAAVLAPEVHGAVLGPC
jgi:hypothetical protein